MLSFTLFLLVVAPLLMFFGFYQTANSKKTTQEEETEEEEMTEVSTEVKANVGRVRRCSAGSSAFLKLTFSDEYHATIAVGVMFLKEYPGADFWRETMKEKMLVYPRFRSFASIDNGQAVFTEMAVDDVDMEYHVAEVFPGHSDQSFSITELHEFIGSMDTKMDLTKPLWQHLLVPRLEDGRCAVIQRIDHGVGDGMSLMSTLFSMIDNPDQVVPASSSKVLSDIPKEAVEEAVKEEAEEEEEEEEEEEGDKKDKKKKKRSSKRLSKKAAAAVRHVKRKALPSTSPFTRASAFFSGLMEGLSTPFTASDTKNKLKLVDPKQAAKTKAIAVSDKVEFERVREIKMLLEGATINDVLMTMMAMTLKRYYEENDESALKKENTIRGNYPIDLRPRGGQLGPEDLGNVIGFGDLYFDFESEDYVDVFWKLKKQLDRNKMSPAPAIRYGIAKAIVHRLPDNLLFPRLLDLVSKPTAMLSNVPGPRSEVSMNGLQLDDMYFFLQAAIGLYFGIITYKGYVTASVSLDSICEGDATQLTKHWATEFDKLYDAVKEASEAAGGSLSAPK